MAITFDSSAVESNAGASVSFSHVLGGGANRCVVVAISARGNGGTTLPSSVTYNGVAMTLFATCVTTSFDQRAGLYYLNNASLPAAGTYTVSVTTPGAFQLVVGCLSFAGVKQVSPEASGQAISSGGASTFLSASITPISADAWMVGAISAEISTAAPAWTCTAGLVPTSRTSENVDASDGSTSTTVAPVASTFTITATYPGNYNRAAMCLMALAPVDAGGRPSALLIKPASGIPVVIRSDRTLVVKL